MQVLKTLKNMLLEDILFLNMILFQITLNKIVYRAGFRYENTGLLINNQSINDYGMNFGIGLPVTYSKINIGVEFGKKGTTSNGLIEENYFNLSIGLSLSDKWFRKRKID